MDARASKHPRAQSIAGALVLEVEEGLNAPDLQGVFTPASYREGYIGMLDNYPGMTCGVWQHRPESLGYVHARSSNPLQDPIVQPNYLEDPRDQQVLLGGMRVARRCLRHAGTGKVL